MQYEKLIEQKINGINILIVKMQNNTLRLLNFSPFEFNDSWLKNEPDDLKWHTLTEIQASGCNPDDHHGGKHCQSRFWKKQPPVYESHCWRTTEKGQKLEIRLISENIRVCHHFQFIADLPLAEIHVSLENNSNRTIDIEYIASFSLYGLTNCSEEKWGEISRISIPHNSWKAESQWRTYTPDELGLYNVESVPFSTKRIWASNTGTWTSKEYLPMGVFANEAAQSRLFWEIHSPGSWTWEISNLNNQLYLQLSGPAERENLWMKRLNAGDQYSSVPVMVGTIQGSTEQAFQILNKGRRAIRRNNTDNINLPVIFNDYMNCLFADPTTEKELPLIDRAAELGAEYYVIDAGWYDDGPWWDGVGKWEPCDSRFPGGIEKLLQCIRDKGMVPGLWLEIERMGIKCPLASEWPDECFFVRNGHRVIDHSSYQLDFRHPIVKAHADEVVRRLVEDYGVGFIKMDYNIDAGPGSETDSDSFGDGLLQHQQAYIAWIKELFSKYPDLVIEHCSSGGLRMSYAYMQHHSVCSTTDNEDYKSNAIVSVNSTACVCPEQAGVWVYPVAGSDEEVAMNLINGMLWRMYLSGKVMDMDSNSIGLIKEAVKYYKKLREIIPQSDPVWPLGLADFYAENAVFGLKYGNDIYLGIWRFSGSETVEIPLKDYGEISSVTLEFPASFPCEINTSDDILQITVPEENSARLIKISLIPGS